MLKVLLLLLGCLALTSGKRATRIRNGRPMSQGEMDRSYPFVVYVMDCGGSMCSACTGTLVSDNTVLLAAHCLCKYGGRGLTVSSNQSTANEEHGCLRVSKSK